MYEYVSVFNKMRFPFVSLILMLCLLVMPSEDCSTKWVLLLLLKTARLQIYLFNTLSKSNMFSTKEPVKPLQIYIDILWEEPVTSAGSLNNLMLLVSLNKIRITFLIIMIRKMNLE